jgi:hypothetical protein
MLKRAGVLASFSSEEKFLAARRALSQNAIPDWEGMSPYPVKEDWPSKKPSPLEKIALIAALCGFSIGALMQIYANLYAYKINSGGRPLFSWPAFVPVCFELTILFAALSVFFFLWHFLTLPRPYHSVFNLETMDLSQERFYLFVPEIRALEEYGLREMFMELGAERVEDCPL